jgi:dTDP-4-amino-4,6-dideoxygalactose transaminase
MKTNIHDLAILGGRAVFQNPLHVGRPNIGNRERLIERINELLDRRFLTNNGPFVQEFEQRIADFTGVKHCIAMCNATVALEITIRAAGLYGEVIVPSFTFIATAHALNWQEITPVFCDIDPQTYTIEPSRVEQLITPRTTGIIGVHLWGHPCDVQGLTEVGQRHNLKILYDAAHAFGCSYNGQMIGNFGNAEIFSFHATKFINSFEGGAVTTNDDSLAEKIRLMKNFGFVDYDDVEYIGTNGKMSEASAAMGITSLESLDDFIAINYRNYRHYQRQLVEIPGIELIHYNENERCNYQYIVLEIDETVTRLDRDQLQMILWAENVLARRYFYPGCHRMEPYRSYLPNAGLLLPNTERIARRVLTLPTGAAINLEEINKICEILLFVVKHGSRIREQLKAQTASSVSANSTLQLKV